ncbi:MAG TPA: DUF2125 domain-containing protein [Caulobacterales bacterium]|nr:DUF2125 domain-containing protein [Caulobacterales bacterium]
MKRSRFWLYAPWALFLLLAACWIGYWFVLANGAQQRVMDLLAAQRAAGAEAQVGRISTHGFPVLLRLELDDVAYAPRQRNWRAATPRLDLNINVLNPNHLILQQRAPISIDRPGAHAEIDAEVSLMSLRMQGAQLAEARLESDALSLEERGRPGAATVQKLVAAMRPDPRAATDYQLAIQATGLHLARPVRTFEHFGQDIALANAAIVLEGAAALLEPADPLEHWRAAGGTARLEGMTLNWGPLEANAQGAVGLDAQHRLQGALQAALPRPSAALNALAQSPSLSYQQKNALSVFALGLAFSNHDVRVHLEAGDGVLKLEHVPVRTLAPVY